MIHAQVVEEVTSTNSAGGWPQHVMDQEDALSLMGFSKLIYKYRGGSISTQDLELCEDQESNILRRTLKSAPDTHPLLWIEDDSNGFEGCVFMSVAANFIAIVVRGTDELLDWASNLDIRFTRMRKHPTHGRLFPRDVSVHRGYYTQAFASGYFDSMLSIVQEKLTANPQMRVFVTGHSKGAGIATIFAYTLAHVLNTDSATHVSVSLASFAGPRIGNFGFARDSKRLEQCGRLKHLRVTLGDDPIPQVPPVPFRHTGTHLHFDIFGNFELDEEDLAEIRKKCCLCCRRPRTRGGAIASVEDHDPGRYYSALERATPNTVEVVRFSSASN